MATYELELWSIQGYRVADISQLAKERQFTMERNEAETLTFTMDTDAFTAYCRDKLGQDDPRVILFPYRTDVKIKRNGEYMFGAQVVSVSADYQAGGNTMSVECTGYLNLLQDRYVNKTYAQVEATSIATDLITTTQTGTNASLGITINPSQYATGILRDRTYEAANVKQEIQRLTALRAGRFDFAISYDKVFSTYAQLGSVRPDLAFKYPGTEIVSVRIERSGLNLYNTILGYGSGFGADKLVSIQQDSDSQLTYYMREKVSMFNNVIYQDTLDENTQVLLNRYKDILEIPVITITGKVFENGKPFVKIGDRIGVDMTSQPYYSNINGLYKLERLEVTLDDNDFESAIALYFDNQDVDQAEMDEYEADIQE